MIQQIRESINVEALATQVVEFLPRIAMAIAILISVVVFIKVTQGWLRNALEKADFDPVLNSLLVDNLYRYTLVALGLIMSLSQLGVNVTAALAGVGVAGIAIGFAAQDSVANVISGILIFWDKPFVVGDWIETESEYGCVTNITLRTTRIRTPRNTYIVIPNKRIIDEVLENYSKHGEVRIDVPVGIAYKETIDRARAALLKAVDSIDQVLPEPDADVVVDELGGSSVNLKVRVWIADADHHQATFFDVMEASKRALDEAGVEIPFPHLQLFIDDVQERVWKRMSTVVNPNGNPP